MYGQRAERHSDSAIDRICWLLRSSQVSRQKPDSDPPPRVGGHDGLGTTVSCRLVYLDAWHSAPACIWSARGAAQ